ncbi:MAG: heme lyase NrfEFG subunit NrfE [Candidatus Pelagibacter sp.]|nr:heme lyase NrfEFG subunit NrfE [Candidatus Pelagibacter sp.]
MIPSFGNFTLWIALSLAILQLLISMKKSSFLTIKFNRIAVKGFLLCTFISFFSLIYCYVVSDFSVLNVFQNSHTSKPLLYKFTAVWGNHEGSMLLWLLVLAIFNYYILKLYTQNNFVFISKTLETQAIINIGFLLFIIFTSNPFERTLQIHDNGLGFNPILQDPALAIHPPLLYVGYVGFSAAFSFAVATMNLKEEENIYWYSYMKSFVIAAWTFLTIGITFGSLWAYYELGWGGWWFWDPVENASLMPWLLGTALIHSLIVVEKKKSLKSWALLLAIVTFLFSIVGTFLVRSGILTSVHSFALDPARGIYILTFIALLGGYSLTLYGIKSKNFLNKNYFSFFSREGSILVNNTIIIIACATIFLGTLYPLLIEIFSNNKISVGEPYFNSTVVPIMMPAILIMGIGPLMSWNKTDIKKVFLRTYPSLLLTIIVTCVFFYIYRSYNILGLLGIILSLWIIFNILITSIKQFRSKYKKEKFIKEDIPKFSIGMAMSHLGFGLLIIGITGSSVWQNEKIIKMKINANTTIQNYKIVFNEISDIQGPNYLAIQGNFLVYDAKKNIVTKLKPETRYYPVTNNTTTEASIHTNLLRDLYIVLGKGNINEGWIVRIYYNPLVIWIWIGASIIFLGGLFSMKNHLTKIKRIIL